MDNEDLKDIKEEISSKKNTKHNQEEIDEEVSKQKEEKPEEEIDKENTSKESEEPETKKETKKDKKLKKKLEEVEKQRDEFEQDYLRLRADFDNYRKRKEKEIQEARERTLSSFIEEILPMIDNFEMSLKMTNNTEMFVKGVEMIHKSLIDKLKENHVEPFEAEIGESFDVHKHEPIPVETDDEDKEGKIIENVKKGYLHKKSDKVIRPAKVKIHVKKDSKKE